MNYRAQLGVGDNVNNNVLTSVDFGSGIEVAQVSASGRSYTVKMRCILFIHSRYSILWKVVVSNIKLVICFLP